MDLFYGRWNRGAFLERGGELLKEAGVKERHRWREHSRCIIHTHAMATINTWVTSSRYFCVMTRC